MAGVPVDMELRKAFKELQVMVFETTDKIRMHDVKIESIKRAKQHAFLTRQEITGISDSTPMYKQIGRMFVLSDKNSTLKSLDEKAKNLDSKVVELETSKKYLEKSMKESEENLRELVASKQKDS